MEDWEELGRSHERDRTFDGAKDWVVEAGRGEAPEGVSVAVRGHDVHSERAKAAKEVDRRALVLVDLLYKEVDLPDV